jgi:hypothetical protein
VPLRGGMGRRAARATIYALFNALLWLYVPRLYLGLLGPLLPAPPPGPGLMALGLGITALQAAATLLEGTALGAGLSSGAFLASAYLTYLLANGGRLALALKNISVELNFAALLWVLLLPLLFNAIKAPLLYLLREE